MKKLILLCMLAYIALPGFSQATDTENPAGIYRASSSRLNDLLHTRLKIKFDYDKAFAYGNVWLTLHPHFYATDITEIDAKGMIIHKVALQKGQTLLSLKKKGHSVFYASIPDNRHFVEKMGFDFYEVFGELYPKGFSSEFKRLQSANAPVYDRAGHLQQIMDGAFDGILQQTGADLLIVSFFLEVESLLLYYRYRLPTIIFTPILRNPDVTRVRSCLDHINRLPEGIADSLLYFLQKIGAPSDIRELIQPMHDFYEIVSCPPEFELNRQRAIGNTFYIEPSIRQADHNVSNPINNIMQNSKRIIYASLGSQAIRYGTACVIFFRKMTEMMRCKEMQDLHLVLSIGNEFDRSQLEPVPENVSVVQWISQIEILKMAALVITHGGLGTVKESIFHGVPMLVFPQRHDQPHIAELVAWHRIGLSAWDEFSGYPYPSKRPDDAVLLDLLQHAPADIYFDKQGTPPVEHAADIIEQAFKTANVDYEKKKEKNAARWDSFNRLQIMHLSNIREFGKTDIPSDGYPDNGEMIQEAGFQFHPLFEKHYPKGFRLRYKQLKKEKGLHRTVSLADHLEDFMNGSFTRFLDTIQPDLLIMSTFLHTEAPLLYYQSRIRPVLLNPILREPGMSIAADCVRDMMNLPPGTTLNLFQSSAIHSLLLPTSQNHWKLFRIFFEKLIHTMQRPGMSNMHLVITAGEKNDSMEYTCDLPNVTVVKWISQMDMLERSSVALVHGGLGTIKECIHFGVPMLVMPVTHDQPSNAKRVTSHRLGMEVDIRHINEEELEQKIREVGEDPTIKNSLLQMREKFREADSQQRGLAMIGQLLPGKGVTV